jgi:hypothetical protein
VLNFNRREIREPDGLARSAVRAIGSQVGQYLQRKHPEDS